MDSQAMAMQIASPTCFRNIEPNGHGEIGSDIVLTQQDALRN
jgi:hypothetical protein